MCHHMWLHFRYCPHLCILVNRDCKYLDLNITPVFCPDYKHESKELLDACPRPNCQRRKQEQIHKSVNDDHAYILAVAAQKTMLRETYGIPDLIQTKIAEIGALQHAELMNIGLEEAWAHQKQFMFRPDVASTLLDGSMPNLTQPLEPTPVPSEHLPSTHVYQRNLGRRQKFRTGQIQYPPQRRVQRYPAMLASEYAHGADLATPQRSISSQAGQGSLGSRSQQTAIRFGVRGGMVMTSTPHSNSRTDMPQTPQRHGQLGSAKPSFEGASNGAHHHGSTSAVHHKMR